MRRRVVLFVAAVCGVGAVLLAVLPYTGRVSFEGQMVLGGAGVAGARGIEGDCGPPIIGAWWAGPEGVWAATDGTNMEGNNGYATTGSLGRWCESGARRRLLTAGGLGAVAVGAGIFGRRRQHPVGEAFEPAPE